VPGAGIYAHGLRFTWPKACRVLMAVGRDASDVALTTSFGLAPLADFHVVSDEIMEMEGSAPIVPMSSAI
jgi:hypothetical protein